jgi:hypothetical protein
MPTIPITRIIFDTVRHDRLVVAAGIFRRTPGLTSG